MQVIGSLWIFWIPVPSGNVAGECVRNRETHDLLDILHIPPPCYPLQQWGVCSIEGGLLVEGGLSAEDILGEPDVRL
jgi:hypothetical protein